MKHGIEQHLVRPDRVYATGVLTPIVGYQPTRDAMAVAARFVSDRGLAGIGLGQTFGSRVRDAIAALRVRWQARRIARRAVLPAGVSQVAEIDTSPRPPAPSPTALAVQSGWAPAPMSPASVSARLRDLFGARAPALPAVAAGAQIAPQGALAPAAFWRGIMQEGLPPVVAARSEADVLRRFYANRLPGAGY